MRDSVPSGSYSSVCNVLRQWQSRSSLLIESIDSMIESTDSMIESTDSMIIFVSMGSPFGPAWAPRKRATRKRKAG